MEDSGRKYLTGSIMLSRKEDGSAPVKFTIEAENSVIGEGGSSVCYAARRTLENGSVVTGKLKEFYPADAVIGSRAHYYSLERLPNGQLVPGIGTVRKFDEMCRDYIRSYELLWKVMEDNPNTEVLKNYIQEGEVFYGCGEPEGALSSTFPFFRKKGLRATVYIWSRGVSGKGFDKYLAEVRANPGRKPEKSLQNILETTNSLTDCIKAMHTGGLLHLDINPTNFLVKYDSDFKIKTGSVSLFDINTLCSVDSEYINAAGTEGFCAPEVKRGRIDNRSDIYSIGAMLFNALVITDEIPDGLYRDTYYHDINRLVRQSALFQASETNSDSALMFRICRILENCLAVSPKKRYQSCSELRTDLEKALDRIKVLHHKPIAKPKEGLSDPGIVIQKLLHEHPLYEAVPKAAKLNVLVIGAGAYGQKFIDCCLQAGQMAGVKLSITAVSDESEDDMNIYLRFRPALGEFVNINGSLTGREESAFAKLEFHGIPEVENKKQQFSGSQENNRAIVEKLINGTEYHYVFVALGEDGVCSQIAKLCSDRLYSQQGVRYPVCYVKQTKAKQKVRDIAEKIYPVLINKPIDVASIDQRLGEMAFNAHISWNSNMNIDVTKERLSFFAGESSEEKYDRASSLAFALSLKYKLHSVGIDREDPMGAAEAFSKEVLEEKSGKKFNELVCLEHRRWIIEKAVDGWTAPRDKNGQLDLEACISRGSVKDKTEQTHPCMVRSSETSPLSSSAYRNNHAKWNDAPIDPALDELDRMSLELHRCFRRHAEQMKKESLQQNQDLRYIQDLIPTECDDVEKAFGQFKFALKNIINGVERYTRQYKYYEDIFCESAKVLSEETQVKIKERLDIIRHAFFPVIESNLYRNYKENDEKLIRRIPFILTYRYMPAIAMAFEDGRDQDGRNEMVFPNVAAATVLSPERLVYLYCFDDRSYVDLLSGKLDAVLNYFGRRKVHCGIEIVIAVLESVPDCVWEHLQKSLDSLKEKYKRGTDNAWVENVLIESVKNHEEAADWLEEYLKEHPTDLFDGGSRLFSSVFQNSIFLGKIRNLKIPYYEFDWRNKVFVQRDGCEYLRFVEDDSFIRISDMFSLMKAARTQFDLPEFAEDYEELWKIYTGIGLGKNCFEESVLAWNRLCASMKTYENSRSPLARLTVSTSSDPVYKRLIYFLPEYTFFAVKKLLIRLKKCGIVKETSDLIIHTSDTCRLEVITREEYAEKINAVFMNPQMLLPYYNPEVEMFSNNDKEHVVIRCDDLSVVNADLGNVGKKGNVSPIDILRELEKAHFIVQLNVSPDSKRVSFKYSSPRIKRLLTTSGEILEIYAYYEVLKTDYFDDIVTGFEFEWERSDVKNELDLVLTKGFRSIIVECKAVDKLDQNYYHKLDSIANRFGIGTTKVMLGNTYVHSNPNIRNTNDMQRGRGEKMNIRTISDEREIIDIGRTLKNLMEEK